MSSFYKLHQEDRKVDSGVLNAKVEALLAIGADINEKRGGDSPLTYFLSSPFFRYDIAEVLISKGADVNVHGQWGYTALHHAAMNCRSYEEHPRITASMPESMAKLLIAKGADVDAIAGTDADVFSGATPLHVAADRGNMGVLKQLIASGANVNTKNASGITPIVMAIEEGRMDAARDLIAGGAQLDANDVREKRRRPRDMWGGSTLLHRACESNDDSSLNIARLLVSLGADVTAKDSHGRPPLMGAVKGNSTAGRLVSVARPMLEFLIANGADLTCADKDGYTALGIAEERGNGWAVPILKRPLKVKNDRVQSQYAIAKIVESPKRTAAGRSVDTPTRQWWKFWG
jgi:ankyrin repeat protein